MSPRSRQDGGSRPSACPRRAWYDARAVVSHRPRYAEACRLPWPSLCGDATRCSRRKEPSMTHVPKRPGPRHELAPHMRPRLGSALFDLATSVIAYLAIATVMFLAMGVS